MLSEQIQYQSNPVMDLLNHIEHEVSILDVKEITFRMQNDWEMTVTNTYDISAVNNDKNFICVRKNNKSYFLNMNQLIEVVVEYDNNNS